MYAQHRSAANIPKNYSGNAFRYPPIGALTDPPRRERETERPLVEEEPHEQNQPSEPSKQALVTPILPPATAPDSVPDLLRGISQAFGNEELLLIGLFLLLSGNTEKHDGQRSDLLFYLLLLFFCG